MVLGCRCGVELVVCVSVVRVCGCFWVVVWFFGAVFEWAFGCQRACGVCSRLLEMADVRSPSPTRRRGGRGERRLRQRRAEPFHLGRLDAHRGLIPLLAEVRARVANQQHAVWVALFGAAGPAVEVGMIVVRTALNEPARHLAIVDGYRAHMDLNEVAHAPRVGL